MSPPDRKQTEKAFWDGQTYQHRRTFRRHWYRFANQYLWQRVLEASGDLHGRRLLFRVVPLVKWLAWSVILAGRMKGAADGV